MINVLIDTNFLIYAFYNKWDLEQMLKDLFTENVKMFYLKSQVDELKRLHKDEVLSWVKMQRFSLIDDNENSLNVDDILIKIAKNKGFYILTEDRGLIKRALKSNIGIISKGNKLSLKLLSSKV